MNLLVKKSLFLAFFALAAPIYGQQVIKEKHVPTYVLDCLDYWFYPNHTNPQLQGLARSITAEITRSDNFDYEWNWSFFYYEKIYPLDYVEQIIRGAIIQFVTETSYSYARDITTRENARRIADYIYNYLFAYCSQTAILSQSVFAGCIGNDLRIWVKNIYFDLR